MNLEQDELPNIATILYHQFQDTQWASYFHTHENEIFSFIAVVCLGIFFYFGTRNIKIIPTGFQNGLEWIAESIRKIVVEIIGPKGEKYVPFLGTLFVYILSMNLLGLVPLMKSPTSSLSITAGMAICVFGYVQYLNIKHMGIKGFIYHMAGSPKDTIGWVMVPLMLPMEMITQFARPLTLALRLCGNILGEDIFLGLSVIFAVYLFSGTPMPFGLPLQLPFMFLGVFTSFLQALVFTLLSTIYILLSMEDAEHEYPN